jgi:hypothetical protein
MVHPSRVLHAAFAAAGLLPPSPSHVAQSSGARKAGVRSDFACSAEGVSINAFAGTVTKIQASKLAEDVRFRP